MSVKYYTNNELIPISEIAISGLSQVINGVTKVWVGTQSEYDELSDSTKNDPSVMCIIVHEDGSISDMTEIIIGGDPAWIRPETPVVYEWEQGTINDNSGTGNNSDKRVRTFIDIPDDTLNTDGYMCVHVSAFDTQNNPLRYCVYCYDANGDYMYSTTSSKYATNSWTFQDRMVIDNTVKRVGIILSYENNENLTPADVGTTQIAFKPATKTVRTLTDGSYEWEAGGIQDSNGQNTGARNDRIRTKGYVELSCPAPERCITTLRMETTDGTTTTALKGGNYYYTQNKYYLGCDSWYSDSRPILSKKESGCIRVVISGDPTAPLSVTLTEYY